MRSHTCLVLLVVLSYNLSSASVGKWSSQTANVIIGLTNTAPSTAAPPTRATLAVCAVGKANPAPEETQRMECAAGLQAGRYLVALREGVTDYMTLCEVQAWGFDDSNVS